METRPIIALFIFVLFGLGSSNSFAEMNGGTAPTSLTNNIKPIVPDVFNQNAYYTFRPDPRKCPSPICGGVFVKQVNKKKTLCADGSYQNECYIAAVNWAVKGTPTLNTGKDGMLLQGFIANKNFPSFGPLGVFRVHSAYTPVVNKQLNSKLLFVGLENNGILCITTPCFSYDEQLLNSNKIRRVSNVDLNQVGASKKQLDAAHNSLAEGKVLLAAGYNQQTNEPFGLGLVFIAKQFYLPVKKPAGTCPIGYDAIAGQCVTPIGCVAPKIELEAQGGVAYIDPVTGVVTSTITKSCVTTCEPPGILDKPAHCSVFYP